MMWQPPPLIANISSDTEEDRFVSVVQTAPASFHMVFTRQMPSNLFDSTSDVFTSSSSDGLNWSAPTQLISDVLDQVFDLFPNFIFAPLAQQWYLSWTSTAFTVGGVVVLPLGGQYPAQAIDRDSAINVKGFSTRVAGPLMVWVNTTTGTPQLWATMNPL